jgi:formylglycine-generating enzyme required for sulfatase activity
MYIKRSLLLAGVLFVTASSLSTTSIAQENPNYHKSRTRPVIPFRHLTLAAPPGMVYIPGGSVTIKYSQSSTDTNSKKRVSLSSFYIDKTEVTNQQYRMFSEWVIDSIAIVKYLKDDKYFIDPPASAANADEENGKGRKKKGKNKDKGEDTATAPSFLAVDSAATPATDTIPTALGSDIATTTTPTVSDTSAAKLIDTSKVSAAAVDTSGPVKRRINWSKVKHKNIFDSNDDEIKAKIAPMYDPVTGKVREELYVYNFTYLRATGTNKNVKVGEYVTEQINIYPDTKIWFKDLVNSQVEILVENYFTQPPFDDYPVVGVTWKQARAFAAWRSHTNFDYATIAEYLKYYRLQFSLPSEAQWVYAAGKDIKDSKQPVMDKEPEPEATPEPAVVTDSATLAATTVNADGTTTPVTDSTATITPAVDTTAVAITDTEDGNDKKSKKDKKKKKKNRKNKDDEETDEELSPETVIAVNDKDAIPLDRDRDGNLLVNFKQEEGDYTEDGSNFTLPVMSYAPNEFGVYNMIGNVAEWVLDAYSPSAFAFVSDINPVLLYDADSVEADPMKRKVVRGGSFVSNAKALSPFTRDFELQDQVHCYIGFRCVMSAPEILTKYVATRRVQTGSKKPNMTSMEKAKPTSSATTKAKPAETKPTTTKK